MAEVPSLDEFISVIELNVPASIPAHFGAYSSWEGLYLALSDSCPHQFPPLQGLGQPGRGPSALVQDQGLHAFPSRAA